MEASTRTAPAAEACRGAFYDIGRFLMVCASGRLPPGAIAPSGLDEALKAGSGAGLPAALTRSLPGTRGKPQQPQGPMLADLTVGPYFFVAAYLNASALGHLDAVCRQFRDLNRTNGGPWCALGSRMFLGLELESDGIFEAVEPERDGGTCEAMMSGRRVSRIDWKCRFASFCLYVPTFRAPFHGPEISEVQQIDEIAYCKCRLRTDILSANSDTGIYLEVDVLANPDNVSLAVVDFEAGGCSSVTFSPDTGAVIRERKVCEAPRKVEGAYIQPLSTITNGRGFEGSMGMHLHGGQLAFFRRHAARSGEAESEVTMGPWECTGFVTDLSWAEGTRLTPCLAFRNEGKYMTRVVCVASQPPVLPGRTAMAFQEASWSSLDWDADQQDPVMDVIGA